MKRIALSVMVTLAVMSMLFVGVTRADVPPPPANQDLGILDGVFNNLTEAECRVCHDDPNHPCSTSNVDRHHLYYGQAIKQGACSVNGTACLSDDTCDPDICENQGNTCADDTDCQLGLGETCGEVCRGETVAPILDADGDGVDDTNYGCLNCHEQDSSGGVIAFIVERDCLACHIQVPGEGSVHHLTDVAQGRDSPLGDPDVGDCTPCHGTLVDDIGDGHIIPFYTPSLVTPVPSGGIGEPLNIYGNGAGGCDYCHDFDGDPDPDTRIIWANNDTHHNTGVFRSETGATNQDVCLWCHNFTGLPPEFDIRVCEGCHGYESLHNIAADTDSVPTCFYDPANPTACEVVVGGEDPGYSHVGNDSDCWGCHGNYIPTAASGSGPVTPFISDADGTVMTAGADASFTLTGASLTNLIGTFRWVSDVSLTAVDGSSVTLTPDSIDKDSLTVTIPGTTGIGTYKLQAVKGTYAASNPVVITVKPEVRIDQVTNVGETYTITGTGFGDAPPEGAEDYLNVQINGGAADVMSWSDTEIIASVSGYGASDAGDTITVNALFCNASFEGSDPGCTPDCNGNFDADDDVDGADAAAFKADFGRNAINSPCVTGDFCNGDFDCDGDVDGSDAAVFKEDFGRGSLNNPCQPCTEACSY
jgi:hypothetical protein